jgi:hypothetical protein
MKIPAAAAVSGYPQPGILPSVSFGKPALMETGGSLPWKSLGICGKVKGKNIKGKGRERYHGSQGI